MLPPVHAADMSVPSGDGETTTYVPMEAWAKVRHNPPPAALSRLTRTAALSTGRGRATSRQLHHLLELGIGSMLLLAATAVSLTLANTSLGGTPYINFWETHMGPASLALHVSIKEWINEVRSRSSCAWSARNSARLNSELAVRGAREFAAAQATRGCECGQRERGRGRQVAGGAAAVVVGRRRGSHG